jgi:hypothetical protein
MAELKIYDDLGGQRNIGYERTDVPIVHVVVRAPGGAAFARAEIALHFKVCDVCRGHAMTLKKFDTFMKEQRSNG